MSLLYGSGEMILYFHDSLFIVYWQTYPGVSEQDVFPDIVGY